MADQTDRQRAEAKASELTCLALGSEEGTTYLGPKYFRVKAAVFGALLEVEQRARSEGWEAGREEAAKLHDADAEHFERIVRKRQVEGDVEGAERHLRLVNIERGHAARIRSLKPKES